MRTIGRRRFARLVVGGAATALAGCGDSSGGVKESADVIAGPGGRLVFDPPEITIPAGESITWFFDSPGHNVSCRPDDSGRVQLPSGAEPFASYGPDEPAGTLVPRGETFTYTFDVPGTYVYVCVPHQSADMVGRVRVT